MTRTGAHTRMPIYEKTIDNIVGIVNTKDLFYLFSLRGIVVLEDAMYPALFLNADDEVAEGLKCFRSNHRHMAVVRDAEGHVLGLITLEDILEEIVGEIEDEHDLQTPEARLRGQRAKTGQAGRKNAGLPVTWWGHPKPRKQIATGLGARR